MAIINSPAIWGITRELFDAPTASWGRLSVERADEASGSIFFDNLPTSLKQGLLDSNGDADLSKVNAFFNNKAQSIINGIVKFAGILSKIEFSKLPADPPTKEFLRDAVLLTIDFALVNSMREKVVSNTFQSSQYTIGQDLTNWLTAPDIMGTAAYDAFLNSKIMQMKLVEDANGVLASDGKKYLIQYQGTLYGFGKFKTGENVSDYSLVNYTGGVSGTQLQISTTADMLERTSSLFTNNVLGAEQDEDDLTYPTNEAGYSIAYMRDQTPELGNAYSRNWLLSRAWFEKYVKPKIFKNKTDIAANLNAINNLNPSATSPQIEANRVKIDEIDKAVFDDGTNIRKKLSAMDGTTADKTPVTQKIIDDNVLPKITANTNILNYKNVKNNAGSTTKVPLSDMDGVNDTTTLPTIDYLKTTYEPTIINNTNSALKNKNDILAINTAQTLQDAKIQQNSDNINTLQTGSVNPQIEINRVNISEYKNQQDNINEGFVNIEEEDTLMSIIDKEFTKGGLIFDDNTLSVGYDKSETDNFVQGERVWIKLVKKPASTKILSNDIIYMSSPQYNKSGFEVEYENILGSSLFVSVNETVTLIQRNPSLTTDTTTIDLILNNYKLDSIYQLSNKKIYNIENKLDQYQLISDDERVITKNVNIAPVVGDIILTYNLTNDILDGVITNDNLLLKFENNGELFYLKTLFNIPNLTSKFNDETIKINTTLTSIIIEVKHDIIKKLQYYNLKNIYILPTNESRYVPRVLSQNIHFNNFATLKSYVNLAELVSVELVGTLNGVITGSVSIIDDTTGITITGMFNYRNGMTHILYYGNFIIKPNLSVDLNDTAQYVNLPRDNSIYLLKNKSNTPSIEYIKVVEDSIELVKADGSKTNLTFFRRA